MLTSLPSNDLNLTYFKRETVIVAIYIILSRKQLLKPHLTITIRGQFFQINPSVNIF
jgi:hypothetical protein